MDDTTSTLLFQPPAQKVKVFYRGHGFVLECGGGLTFGAITRGLRDLRNQSQKTVDKVVKLPCTSRNRDRYAHAMEVLGGPPPRSWNYRHRWYLLRPNSHIYLVAEDAISDDSRDIRVARGEVTASDWWPW
jgi:hypothetical protein